jgi:hypothetical protein
MVTVRTGAGETQAEDPDRVPEVQLHQVVHPVAGQPVVVQELALVPEQLPHLQYLPLEHIMMIHPRFTVKHPTQPMMEDPVSMTLL